MRRKIFETAIGNVVLRMYGFEERVLYPPDKIVLKLHVRVIAMENVEREALADEAWLYSDTFVKEIKIDLNSIDNLEEVIENVKNELANKAKEVFERYVALFRKLYKMDFWILMRRDLHKIRPYY